MIYIDEYKFTSIDDIDDAAIDGARYDEYKRQPYLKILFDVQLAGTDYTVYDVCRILKNAKYIKIDKLYGSKEPLVSNDFEINFISAWSWTYTYREEGEQPENIQVSLKIYDY